MITAFRVIALILFVIAGLGCIGYEDKQHECLMTFVASGILFLLSFLIERILTNL